MDPNGASKISALPAQQAYDLTANFYDNWKWQKFWRKYEGPVVLDIADRAFSQENRGLHVLDIGCGTGWYLEQLKDLATSRTGIDISFGMLQIAKERFADKPPPNPLLMRADIEATRLLSSRYDFVLGTRVFSHIRTPLSLIEKLRKSITPAGWLVLSDVDPSHNYEATKLPLSDGSVYAETFKHSRTELFERIEKAGFVNYQMDLIDENGEVHRIKRFRDHARFRNLAGWVAAWRKSLI